MPGDLDIFARLAFACLLGGLIGIQREINRHPAGLRTHVLVCVGSALAMLCNIYIYFLYKGQTNIDPARFGAQVISGIGFLGAGTIMKEGANIKGLTTAAGLWAVACIGVAIGSGFYKGAVLATAFVLLTLITLSKIEQFIGLDPKYEVIRVNTIDKPGQIGKIGTEIGKFNISIKSIKIEQIDGCNLSVIISMKMPKGVDKTEITTKLTEIEGISQVENLKL